MMKKLMALCLCVFALVGCSKSIYGDYQLIDSYWHLYIDKEYLSIYDNAAGNPGVEGSIISMDDSTITIEIDYDYFDEMPGDTWEEKDGTLTLNYKKTSNGIILENNGEELEFRVDK